MLKHYCFVTKCSKYDGNQMLFFLYRWVLCVSVLRVNTFYVSRVRKHANSIYFVFETHKATYAHLAHLREYGRPHKIRVPPQSRAINFAKNAPANVDSVADVNDIKHPWSTFAHPPIFTRHHSTLFATL